MRFTSEIVILKYDETLMWKKINVFLMEALGIFISAQGTAFCNIQRL